MNARTAKGSAHRSYHLGVGFVYRTVSRRIRGVRKWFANWIFYAGRSRSRGKEENGKNNEAEIENVGMLFTDARI